MHFQACAYCDHPNPVGTNFCNHCGAALHLKPCRRCGAVAVARARHCPACRSDFPHRPTISVDIPWATAGVASSRAAPPGAVPHVAGSEGTYSRPDVSQLAASAQALAETQRLIEKASSRVLPAQPPPELVLSTGGRDEQGSPHAAAIGREQDWARPVSGPRHRQLLLDDVLLAEEAATAEDSEGVASARPAATARHAPMVFLSLLGLVAAIALLYLVQYAGESSSGTIREIASPHKLLVPAAARPVEAAAPIDAAVEHTGTPDQAAAHGTLPAAAGEAGATGSRAEPAAADGPAPRTWMPPGAPSAAPLATPLEVPKDDAAGVTAAVASELPAASQPAAALPPSPAPLPGAGACRPELRALNLCGKVNQRL